MIYFDNAATTWPKPLPVVRAMDEALRRYGANPGRGGHSMGLAASQEVYRCRETAARLFHLSDPSGVIFTLNCTMALNMVLKGLLRTGGRAVVSSLEHNAVMRPLNALSTSGPIYDVARVAEEDDDATVEAFRRCIRPSTRVIVCTHASNVFGTRLPIRRLGQLAREYGLPFVVDAAQTGGVLPIDMEEDNIHFLCLAGHKGLYGPHGDRYAALPGLLLAAPFHRRWNGKQVPGACTALRPARPVGKRHPQHAGNLRFAGGDGAGAFPEPAAYCPPGVGADVPVVPPGEGGSQDPAVYGDAGA